MEQALLNSLSKQELDMCKRSPLYFYNTYVRKEGEPVLDYKQYAERNAKVVKMRSTPGDIPEKLKKQPRTREDSFELIDDTI